MKSKIYLTRRYLTKHGYDMQGDYYGIGLPLYEYCVEIDESISGMLRAVDRQNAKEKVLAELVNKGYDHGKFCFAK
jgi:hypothetical protein